MAEQKCEEKPAEKGCKLENQELSALDRCLAGSVIKIGSGVLAGGVFSVICKKIWPVTLGAGIGIGLAIISCQEQLDSKDVGKKKLGTSK